MSHFSKLTARLSGNDLHSGELRESKRDFMESYGALFIYYVQSMAVAYKPVCFFVFFW